MTIESTEMRASRTASHVLDEIRAHGAETYPDECCGALIRKGGQIVEAYRLPNTTKAGARRRFRIGPNDYRLAEARADLYTPLAVYLKLAGGPYSYLLESVVGGERFGRYSFIGLPCAERIEARGGTVRRLLRDARGADVCLEEVQGEPFEFVRAYLKRHKVAPAPGALYLVRSDSTRSLVISSERLVLKLSMSFRTSLNLGSSARSISRTSSELVPI